jgi:YVTN family beta-propeller protein
MRSRGYGRFVGVAVLSAAVLTVAAGSSMSASASGTGSGKGCAGQVYVANMVDGTVSVVDTKTETVTATVRVGAAPYGVAFSPDGTRAYVSNHVGNSVSVIDPATRAVVATIPVGVDPWDIAVTPDGKHVYTANDGGPDAGWVSDIATRTGAVGAIRGVVGANTIAVRPGGAEAYTSGGLGIVSVIDTKSATVDQATSGSPAQPQWPFGIKLGGFNAEAIRFSPDGRRAYVTTNFDGSLVVVDTKTRAVMNTVKVGNGAVGFAISPDGRQAYVVTHSGVVPVGTRTGAVGTALPASPTAEQVAIAADGRHIFVTGGIGSPTLAVFDTRTGTLTATVPVGRYPAGVAVCPARATKR